MQILRGFLQVGKTALVKDFAKSFDRFIHLNLALSDHYRLYEASYSFQELFADCTGDANP
jgi:hypothetical protein